MEASLEEKEARHNRILQAVRQATTDRDQREEEVNKLNSDIDLAVHKDKDDIARMLIRKRRSLQGSCEQLAHQIEHLNQELSQLDETLSQQRLQYDELKIKVAAFRRQVPTDGIDDASAASDKSQSWRAPTEEEIELELLQRKEAFKKGGAA